MEKGEINEALARMERRAQIALKHVEEDNDPKKAEAWERAAKNYTCAAEALRKFEQYQELGTVDECREATEMRRGKKITHEATRLQCCTCPSCKNVVDEFETIGDSRLRVKFKYCHFCGQKLDWSE